MGELTINHITDR